MAPPAKSADARRKSSTKSTLIITRKVSPDRLRAVIAPDSIKEESPVKDTTAKAGSPAASVSGSQPAASVTNGDNASDSNAATPVPDVTTADGTPAPSAMGPPTEGPKKKRVSSDQPPLPTDQMMAYPSLEESLAPRRSLVWRTVRSIILAPSLLEATSWDPRQTKVLSMLAFALSIALASLVADGPREASNSRALQASHGRFLAGSLPRRRLQSLVLKIRPLPLPRPPRVAPRKIRRMAKRPTVPATATAATTSRCKVPQQPRLIARTSGYRSCLIVIGGRTLSLSLCNLL
ncbi:hypothetical protein NXS19_003795 [Fusarium pseudograminearum]|nr:hypothetical protein NXS19_003795 [Fusarium pseudograminearum]